MATRIKEKYLAEAVPALQQKFGYKNVMEIPKLEKIVINMGLGDCKDNAKAMEMAVSGDIVVLAGKGHETYQEIRGVKHPFDEKVIVSELLEEIAGENRAE